MEEIGLSHRPKRKPNGITKADRETRKSDDLLKRDFTSAEPLKKCITDIAKIKAKDGKLYVSAIFDCFDAAVLGLAMDTNMKAALCRQTLENAVCSYPALREASSAIGITGGYAPLMGGFLLWSGGRDIMNLWIWQLRHCYPCKKSVNQY